MEIFLGQIVALVTFFAFPAIQYGVLKTLARNQGTPQLWFLPRFGFRLVAHNISGRRILSDLRYKVVLRRKVEAGAGAGASVATLDDQVLIDRQDTFCFPGTDQVLVSFRVERSETGGYVFVHTNKLGAELGRFDVGPLDSLIADYTANIENFFNFDVRVAKRSEMFGQSWPRLAEASDVEQQFDLDRVREVG
jgi:hypothetical protein